MTGFNPLSMSSSIAVRGMGEQISLAKVTICRGSQKFGIEVDLAQTGRHLKQLIYEARGHQSEFAIENQRLFKTAPYGTLNDDTTLMSQNIQNGSKLSLSLGTLNPSMPQLSPSGPAHDMGRFVLPSQPLERQARFLSLCYLSRELFLQSGS